MGIGLDVSANSGGDRSLWLNPRPNGKSAKRGLLEVGSKRSIISSVTRKTL